jgi:hypothetical protein
VAEISATLWLKKHDRTPDSATTLASAKIRAEITQGGAGRVIGAPEVMLEANRMELAIGNPPKIAYREQNAIPHRIFVLKGNSEFSKPRPARCASSCSRRPTARGRCRSCPRRSSPKSSMPRRKRSASPSDTSLRRCYVNASPLRSAARRGRRWRSGSITRSSRSPATRSTGTSSGLPSRYDYRDAVAHGEPRLNLDGSPAGVPSEDEQQHAARQVYGPWADKFLAKCATRCKSERLQPNREQNASDKNIN